MTDEPERIWAFHAGPMVGYFVGKPEHGTNVAEYVRVDLFDAMTAERDHWKAIYEAERDDELLNIARQSGWQDGLEERRKLEAEVARLTQERDDALSLTAAAYETAAQKVHWLWNVDGTPIERRVAVETQTAIRALTPADALAAQAARDERMRKEGAKEAGINDYFGSLVGRARTAAAKAAIKFPQPNYVTLKIAEEAGEVVRGAVHFAENRMDWSEVEGEIVQLLAMLIRFVTEGDLVNGVIPPRAALKENSDE